MLRPQRSFPAFVISVAVIAGCGGDSAATTPTATEIANTAPEAAAAADPEAVNFGGSGECEFLFGAPGASTGLGEDVCRPELVCDGSEPFIPPAYTGADIEALRIRVLVDPPGLLPASPYGDSSLVPTDADGVCAVLAAGADGRYRLETYADPTAAEAEGGAVTHFGACGACSSLQDLAVYLSMPDLGDSVKQCALLGMNADEQATLDCIVDLGFSEPCAQIWAFNSANTRESCLTECLAALDSPNHLPDGSLNPCLACDEAESGPVFKAVAGRTRRNSGIPTAICRPGEAVEAVRHDSYP